MRSSKTKILALVLACAISVSGFVTSFANASARSNDSGTGGAGVVDSGGENAEVVDTGTPPIAFMMSRAAFTIKSEAQLTAAFPDENFRKAVFAKVKGCSGADLKAALASFDGSIKADNKGITNIKGLELLTHAEKISLKKNQIKDFSGLYMGNDYYGAKPPQDAEWSNVTWDFAGNPFEKLPENFGGNLVIIQPASSSYVYLTEPTKNRVFLRDTANESFDGVLQIGKCTVGASNKNVKVISAEAHHLEGEEPLFTVTKHTNTTANITEIRTSGEQRVAIGVDEELHYSTTDEFGTVTPGSQSFKYYISPRVLVYDRITLTHNNPTGEVTLTKTGEVTGLPLGGAVYTLYSSTGKPFKKGISTKTDGTCIVGDLPAGDYYFQETKAPLGYKLDPNPTKTFSIGTDGVELTGGEHEINVTASGKKVTANHNEAFLAGKETGADIAFNLIKGDVGTVDVKYSGLDSADGTPSLNAVTKEFKGTTALQDAQDNINAMKNANRITGAVDVKVTFTGKSEVVNKTVTHTNVKADIIDIPVQKIWEDDGDVLGLRPPSVEVMLLCDGAPVSPEKKLTLNEKNGWKGTFSNLLYSNGTGRPYAYKVEEKTVANYTNVVEEDAHSDLWTITNTVVKPASFDIDGTKAWAGNTEPPPTSASFELLQNGVPMYGAQASGKGGWKFKFWDLPINDKNGTPYSYEIKEDAVKGYKPVENYVVTPTGTVGEKIAVEITNVRIPNTPVDPPKPDPSDPDDPSQPAIDALEFEIIGTKQWAGDIETDRPDRVTIELWQNGKILYKDYPTKENNWEIHFWELPIKDRDGGKYRYEIKEQYVAGYSNRITPITGAESGVATVTVTNTKNKPSGGGSDKEPSPSLYPPEDITVEYDALPKPPELPAPPAKNPNTGRIISIDIMRRVGLLKWI